MITPYDSVIVRTACKVLVPFAQVFALYVLFHGHESPGGGFQGGAILGASIILTRFTQSRRLARRYAPGSVAVRLGADGVLIYYAVGAVPFLFVGSFLYYRYLPLYTVGTTETVELPVDAMGTIRGSVTDAETGAPIADAFVRLIVPDAEPVVTRTDTNGDYALFVPDMPDFFALSVSHDGYIPGSNNVNARAVARGPLPVDFDLQRQRDDVIVLEAIPEVHHLGDDRFVGRINSQFQRSSEGARFETTFDLARFPDRHRGAGATRRAADISRRHTSSALNGHEFPSETHQPAPPERAEVRMLVKGVQRRHRIVINGTTLKERLDDAPSDGSFGEFRASFDPSLLRTGTNTFAVIAKPSSSDIDDFEFVNIRIELRP